MTPREEEKRAGGRDLMPVIVVFIFAIVMTFVVITMRSLILEKSRKNAVPEYPELLRNTGRFLDAGERFLAAKKYAEAEKAFTGALNLLEQTGSEDPEFRIAVETRLAKTAEKRGDAPALRKHLKHLEYLMNALWKSLQEKYARAANAPPLPEKGKRAEIGPGKGAGPE